jgi:1-acyl-sn-glycerol-3-phosphate acyltransferase
VAARGGSELNLWWRIGVALTGAVFHLCFRMRVRGLERVPRSGPAVLAGNHLSAIDGVVLGHVVGSRLKRMTRFLVAAEFFESKRLGWALRLYSQIPLRRGEGDIGAIDEAVRTIRGGALSGIYPEGKVNPDPDAGLQRGRRGIARLALVAGAPVIPVGIWGPQHRWPRDGLHFRRPWRPALGMSFGEPIEPKGDPSSPPDLRMFTEQVMTAISKQVDGARALAEGAR